MNTTQRKPPTRARRSTAAAPAIGAPLFDPVEREPAYFRVSSAIESKILSRTLRDGDVRRFRLGRACKRANLRRA